MTFVVDGNEHMVDQVIKQLRKLVDVTRVEDISEQPIVAREMALIRVSTNAENRSEIVQMVNIYRGEIVDVALDSMIVQIVGAEDRVDSLIDLLDNFGIIEMVRTGPVAMARGSDRTHAPPRHCRLARGGQWQGHQRALRTLQDGRRVNRDLEIKRLGIQRLLTLMQTVSSPNHPFNNHTLFQR
jgi:acetolactate synthase-1/3 small subunit